MEPMETNKNSLATGMLAVVVLAAVFLVGILIFGFPGHDVT
jgi:ABC-type transporter Mla subunit MlaD